MFSVRTNVSVNGAEAAFVRGSRRAIMLPWNAPINPIGNDAMVGFAMGSLISCHARS